MTGAQYRSDSISMAKQNAAKTLFPRITLLMADGKERTTSQIHHATGASLDTVRSALMQLIEQGTMHVARYDRNRARVYKIGMGQGVITSKPQTDVLRSADGWIQSDPVVTKAMHAMVAVGRGNRR